MSFAFDVVSGISRLLQTGTDSGATPFAGIDTAISAVVTVARSTAYTTASPPLKPPAANGMWYRCGTAGTTAGVAPTYNPVNGGTITDGTAVFTAFRAPTPLFVGTGSIYFFPDTRLQYQGTLTNTNPQQQTFICRDIIGFGAGAHFTSGAWASNGITPLWDGTHFTTTRVDVSGADGNAFQLQNSAQLTLIGGEVQLSSGVTFQANTVPKTYFTRWRNTKEWGASSSRFRSYTTLAVFKNIEFYDMAFDLFAMPADPPSIKGRGCEYVYQYVGASAGGVDAKFEASSLENPNGTYDFDNYFGGWVELNNCAKGLDLNVTSQYPNSSVWVKHCVPLFQSVEIIAKDNAGVVVPNVYFTVTETPDNPPTVTFTTAGGLKTWDFRTPLSYQATSNASGVATSKPVMQVWYWQSSFKKSRRFPLGAADVNGKQWATATYEGRAFNYKTITVPVELGFDTVTQEAAGMPALDTSCTISMVTAAGIVSVTFTPSGATGGVWSATANATLRDVWHAYRYWIIQFANRPSQDTWSCVSQVIDTALWTGSIVTGVTLSGSPDIVKIKSPSIAIVGTGKITSLYETSVGKSARLNITNLI